MDTLGGIIDSLASTNSSTSNNFGRTRLRAERGKPEPYTCPECGERCEYNEEYPAGPLFLYLRDPCRCEAEEQARKREERIAQARRQLRAGCGLPAGFSGCTLDSLEVVPGIESAIRIAKVYVDRWPTGSGLILSGSYGSGKTAIASGIANGLVEKCVSVVFCHVAGYLLSVADSTRRGQPERLRPERGSLLILDDLVTSDGLRETERAEVFRIVNTRYERRLPVVATVNASREEVVACLGGPVGDRLFGSCHWVEITAPSYRLAHAPTLPDLEAVEAELAVK